MKSLYNTGGRPRWYYLSLFVCVLVILAIGKTTAADQSNQELSKPVSAKRKSSGPYCGVYCLYTVIKLNDQGFDFRELLKPEYISSRKGSTLAELKKAAEDNGLYIFPIGKLTSRELRCCPYQIILHVKSDMNSKQYDHFELFIWTKDGQALLLDPPGPLRLVPFHELAPRWNGNGLIVSTEPIDLSSIFAPARKQLIVYSAVAIAFILALHISKRCLPEMFLNSRGKLLGLSMGQAAGFAVTALLCGMLYHLANDEGLLANANATASIQKSHAGNFIPKIGERKVHKLLDSDTVFIDARLARDYEAGHLKGAISVPVDANDVERQTAVADIPKDSRIVMYCQSSACKYAEIVAIKLIKDNYSNISIFRGGWAEWVAKNGKPKEASI